MRVAIVANTGKEGTRTVVPEFLDILGKAGIEAVLDEYIKREVPDIEGQFLPKSELFKDADIIVSFGGDGTMLHTARLSHGSGVPILGVNLGKVGFLAEISPDEIEAIPKRLLAGDYQVLERMAFTASTNKGDEYFCLNDIVLDRNQESRILKLTVSVDGHHAGDFHADGLIVSTPTGSTAHAMAAGGPLVMPECSAIILAPICPHSLTMRPMIVDGSMTVIVGVSEGVARMAVDGRNYVDVPSGCEVTIRRTVDPVRVARFSDRTYFDILHTRLRWGVSLKLRNA